MENIKEILLYAGWITVIIELIIIWIMAKNMGDQINIKKQVQRNRRSPGNIQEYNAEQNEEKKGILNKLRNKRKLKKNGKS